MKFVELISSAPLVALVKTLRSEVAHIRKRTPNNDVANALESVCNDVDVALREGAQVDVWLTVQEAAGRSHKRPSTVARICREEGPNAGASKVKGVWSINWPKFQAYLERGDTQTQQEAA